MSSQPVPCPVVEEVGGEAGLPKACRRVLQHRLAGLVWKFEFFRFLVAGGLAATANLACAACYRGLLPHTAWYFEASVAFGFTMGTVVSFLLHKFVTFRAEGNVPAEFARFLALSVLSVGLGTLVAHLSFPVVGAVGGSVASEQQVQTAAHVVTILIMLFFNYFVIKHVAFAKG